MWMVSAGRRSACLQLARSAMWTHQSRAMCTSKMGAMEATSNDGADEDDDDDNQFEGKQTRENVHKAFATRAMWAVKYDYFAQRAELESETDAAPLLRSLSEAARQQAMGYLELMEEYGDAQFGSTMNNLDVSASAERSAAEGVCQKAATIAVDEGLEHVGEWFEDMSDAGYRAATRLDQVHSMLEEELMSADGLEDAAEDADVEAKTGSKAARASGGATS